MSHTIIGIFQSPNQAKEAVTYLLSNGFKEEDVDLATGHLDRTNQDYSNSDSIESFFRGIFGDGTQEAENYTAAGKDGAIVTVMAKTSEDAYLVSQLLDNYGAVEVNEQNGSNSQYKESGEHSTESLPIIEEDVHVGKEVVDNGSMRIRSRIIERPIEKTLRLKSETIHINRNPVNRPATQEELENFEEGTIEVTAHKEVPVVNKETRVVEEISIEKTTEEREEIIRDSVRETQVDTEELNNRKDSDTDRAY
jgi:stress response protein YsnF